MTKPTFKLKGRPYKSTSCSHNKNGKTYGTTNAQRGPLSANDCHGFNSNSKMPRIFSNKSASKESKCVNSAHAGVVLGETMPSTSGEPSVIQGNNLLQGNKEVDETETHTNKEGEEREANTDEHKAGKKKKTRRKHETSI